MASRRACKAILSSLVAVGVAGCALASSSGVFPIGNDAYRITTSAGTGLGGLAMARRFAYTAATHECVRRAGRLVVLDDDAHSRFTIANVELTFRCDKPVR